MSLADLIRAKEGERAAETAQNFSARCLRKLMDLFTLQYMHDPDRPEFNFGEFYREYPDFPVRLEARRVHLDLDTFYKKIGKDEGWQALCELSDSLGSFDRIGLIIPFLGLSVLHTHIHLKPVEPSTRVVRLGASGTMGCVLESLPNFANAIKLAGWDRGRG